MQPLFRYLTSPPRLWPWQPRNRWSDKVPFFFSFGEADPIQNITSIHCRLNVGTMLTRRAIIDPALGN